MEETKKFYRDLLGLKLVMDMEWVLTFASHANPTAQITIVKQDKPGEPDISDSGMTVSIEVDNIDELYRQATAANHKILYPITNEPWGVRRFFVLDPNGLTINIMSHISPTK